MRRHRRRLVPFLLAAASALLVPAGAGAATFCVYNPDPCAGTVEPSLQAAIDAAAPDGGGTIRVGFEAPNAPGDHETIRIAAGNAVRIVGDVLDVVDFPAVVTVGGAAPGASPVVIDEPSAEIRNLALADETTTTAPVAELRAGTLSDVVIHASAQGATALHLAGGTLRDGSSVYGTGTAIVADGSAATIADASIFGDGDGLVSATTALTVTRSAIEGDATALRVTAGTLTADDSFFSPSTWDGDPDPAARLIDVAPAAASSATVSLRSATLDGFGLTGTGLGATCAGGATADVTLSDSLAVRATAHDLAASGAGCALHLDHVEYGARGAATGGAAYADGAGVVARPGDATLLERDDPWVQPSWHSPARDAGSAPLAAGETDLLGGPRVVDGARDLGAIEYQHVAPVAGIDGDATATVGEEADYDDGGTYDADHEPLTEAWTLDGMPVPAFSWDDFDGLTDLPPLGQSDGFMWWTPTAPGAHRIGLAVTDPSGLSSSVHGTVTVTGAATGPRPRSPATVVRSPVPTLPAPQPAGPGPQVAPFTEPGLRAAFLRKRRLTASGRLQVQLACVRPTGCTGVVRVLMAGLNTNDRPVVIARLPFRLRSLQTRAYNIVLTRTARRAIVHSAGKGRRVSLVPYEGTGRRLRLVAGGATGTVRAPKRS